MSEQQLRAELDAVYRSTSWRITAPFRLLVSLIKEPRTIVGLPRRIVRKLTHIGMRQDNTQHKESNQASVQDGQAATQMETLDKPVSADNFPHLSSDARDIFRQLKHHYQK